MPIKHFDTYLQDRKQIHGLPLAHLSDTRLGIDACYYLHTLIAPPPSNPSGPSSSSSSFNPAHAPSTSTSSVASIPVLPPSAREPLLAATGGLPLALTQRIEADLRVLEKLRIKPVFVFPGLVPCGSGSAAPGPGNTANTGGNKRWRTQQGQMPGMQPFGGAGIGMDPLVLEACRDRRDAWAKYEQGYEDAATRLFEGRSGIGQWDLWRMVLRIFRHRNVEFLVAPYVAWAQLVYLQRHPKAYIHAIYGPTDVLLYHGVDRLITSLDLYSPSPSFQYTSKRSFLGDLALSEDQFLDVGILLGSDPSPHPSYSSSHPSHSHSHSHSHPNHNQNPNSNASAAYSAYSFTYPHVPTPSFPPTVHDQALKATIDLVKYYKTGHGAICAFDHPAVKGPGGVGPGGGGAGGMGGAGGGSGGGSGAYLELFARARSVVRFGLVMGSEGTVGPLPLALGAVGVHQGQQQQQQQHPHPSQPITPSDIPQDLHEIFTHRLSEEVYFYLSRGLLSPHSLLWLTTGVITEYPPLDNGETTEYKRFVKEVVTEGQTGPRATALAVLCAGLGGWWGGNTGGSSGNNNSSSNSNAGGNSGARKVSGWFWFEQPQGQQGQGQGGQGGGGGGQQGGGKLILHNSPQTVQLAERVAGWNVSYAVIEDELRRQNSSTIDFALCLGATATDRLASRTKIKNPAATPLEKKDEVVANVIWRFLELRGFLLNTHAHSPLARAMYSSILMAKLNDKFQDPLYIFLELVRAGVMHGHLWSGRAFSGGPSFGTDEEKSSMLLIMRVLSIVPLNFKPLPWSAPLSRELLVFNSFIRSLTRALRTLLEVTALNMLLRGDGKRGRDDLLDVALSLPFQGEVNTGFGVLAKVYLDALTHLNGGVRVRREDLERDGGDGGSGAGQNGVGTASAGTVRAMKEMALEVVEETFGGGVKYSKMEVERGFRFWDLALNAMRMMFKEGAVMRELMDQFEAAEAWLAPMRP